MEGENVPDQFGVCRLESRGLGGGSFQLKFMSSYSFMQYSVNIRIQLRESFEVFMRKPGQREVLGVCPLHERYGLFSAYFNKTLLLTGILHKLQ